MRPFTSADDVGGFHAARGILTAQGGKSSHAAIVARGMGRPCVCGATALEIDPDHESLRIGDRVLHPGDVIAIDGTSGVVTADEVHLIPPQVGEAFGEILAWSGSISRAVAPQTQGLPMPRATIAAWEDFPPCAVRIPRAA